MTEQEFKIQLAELNLQYLSLCKARDDYSPAMVEPELTEKGVALMKQAGYVQLSRDEAICAKSTACFGCRYRNDDACLVIYANLQTKLQARLEVAE